MSCKLCNLRRTHFVELIHERLAPSYTEVNIAQQFLQLGEIFFKAADSTPCVSVAYVDEGLGLCAR